MLHRERETERKRKRDREKEKEKEKERQTHLAVGRERGVEKQSQPISICLLEMGEERRGEEGHKRQKWQTGYLAEEQQGSKLPTVTYLTYKGLE